MIKPDDARAAKQSKIKPALYFFMGTGLSISSLHYKGDGPWARNVRSSSSYNPAISMGLDIVPNPSTGRIVIRTEIAGSMAKFHSVSTDTGIESKEQVDYTFTQYAISLSPQLMYSFYSSKNCKIFFGVGIKFYSFSYKNNIYTYTEILPSQRSSSTPDFFLLKKSSFTGAFNFGVLIRKRFEFSASYFPGSGTLNYSGLWDEYLRSIRLGINYKFVKR